LEHLQKSHAEATFKVDPLPSRPEKTLMASRQVWRLGRAPRRTWKVLGVSQAMGVPQYVAGWFISWKVPNKN